MTEIILRLVPAATIIAAGLAAYSLYNRRLARHGTAHLAELGVRGAAKVLVYFHDAVLHSVQDRAAPSRRRG